MTHCEDCGKHGTHCAYVPFTNTYPLGLEMGASQAVMMLIEVHHLEPVELIGDFLDLFFLARLLNLDAFCVPFRPSVRRPMESTEKLSHHLMYSVILAVSLSVSLL